MLNPTDSQRVKQLFNIDMESREECGGEVY
jgi:hypothetical protein